MEKLDNTVYANDPVAQELLANTALIAAENTTDPLTISDRYALLELAVKSNVACALVGPGGTGKSVAVALLANKLGIPLVIFQATAETRSSSLIGRLVPDPSDSSKLIFEKGLLLDAYEKGYWFDCEEYLQFAPDQQSNFMKLLDGSQSYIIKMPDGRIEVVKRHPNFRFIGTGNPDYNGNKERPKNESFLDRIKPAITIPELAAKAIVSMCLQRYPRYKKTKFFKVAFDLNKALSESTKALLRKDLVFGTRGVNSLCEMLEADPTPMTRDLFGIAVEGTFGSSISQIGGGGKILPDLFGDPTISAHIDSLYDEYKKAFGVVDPAQPADAGQTAQKQSAQPSDIFDALAAAGIKA